MLSDWPYQSSDFSSKLAKEGMSLPKEHIVWYQIRNALKKRNESGDAVPVDFSAFEDAYKQLGDKLRPQVYELGFLRV